MPINRIAIGKTTWGKIKNKLERPENQGLAVQLGKLTKTAPSGGGIVLWEPDLNLKAGLRAILEREEIFVRRKGTCSHQELLATIEKLKERNVERPDPETV